MNESQRRRKRGREIAKGKSDQELIEMFDKLPWNQMKEVIAEQIATRFLDSLEEDRGEVDG